MAQRMDMACKAGTPPAWLSRAWTATHAAVAALLTTNHRCNMCPMSVTVLTAVCAVDSVKSMEGACPLCDRVDELFMRCP
jgi:hypothetical protein